MVSLELMSSWTRPSPDTGDSLVLDMTGTLGVKLKELPQGGQLAPSAGTRSFAGLHRPIRSA